MNSGCLIGVKSGLTTRGPDNIGRSTCRCDACKRAEYYRRDRATEAKPSGEGIAR